MRDPYERNRRKRLVRPKTENLQRITDTERRELKEEVRKLPILFRPTSRGHCKDGIRPCPYVGCRHHLYLDVTNTGNILYNFPDLEPEDLEETCALDVADQGGAILETVGALMNITRERVRQLQNIALDKLKRKKELKPWEDDASHQTLTHSPLPSSVTSRL